MGPNNQTPFQHSSQVNGLACETSHHWDTTLNVPNMYEKCGCILLQSSNVTATKFVMFSLGTSIATPGIAGLICLVFCNVLAKIKTNLRRKKLL